ncbi:hypothetical protein NDN08_000706 [Rhodosorus marinus]|uniref:Fe2OG dioxygenase domain-containing protein n=1 Tax=Rhodosorus marinus TaxID=101924 RepID=A0AAV8UQA0_9RHOD|nr:hypothetical protein NDN08_000706 [Rhodosorus marinus]
MDELVELPLINIECLLVDESGEEASETLDALVKACEGFGCGQLVGHGIPVELLAKGREESERFFKSDSGVKMRVKRSEDNARGFMNDELTKNERDAKEAFDFGKDCGVDVDGVNRWPEELPEFRRSLEEYFSRVEELCWKLTKILTTRGLGLPWDSVRSLFEGHSSFCRVNYYVEEFSQHETSLGIQRHTDAGFFTLLATNGVPGLQVYTGDGDGSDREDKAWRTVKPVEDALCFNVADMLQVLSDDRFRSILHRVKTETSDPRLSIAFFWNPSPDIVVQSVTDPVSCSASKYKALSFGEFRRKRFQGDFADVGREAQISDYLL